MAALLLGLSVPALAQTTSSEDLARGKMLYNASCVRCHGIEGTGGEGPTLTSPDLERAPDDEALERVIRSGIPGTDMPGTRHLNEADVRQIATYVRSLGTIESEPLTGDAAAGETLFWADAGCDSCHIVHGKGESLGPELTRVGNRRGTEYLRNHVKDPAAAVPESHLMVRVVTAQGNTIDGMRINEDAFSIQLKDEESRFHSFRKSELKELTKQPRRTFMPRYRNLLSDTEIDNLVAYLASLRGTPQ